jgi:hypothetical protein
MKNNVRIPRGICEEWRMDPRDKGDALTIWIRLLYDLSEAGNPYSEGIEAMHFFTNIDARTWDIATRVIKQNLKQVDMHCRDNLRVRNQPYPQLAFPS